MTNTFNSFFRIDRTGIWTKAKKNPKADKAYDGKPKKITRSHAARQLLALGPLSFGEFAEIMGGSVQSCRRVLSYLVDCRGEVSRIDGIYSLVKSEGHHE
jgi:hypothetical protein